MDIGKNNSFDEITTIRRSIKFKMRLLNNFDQPLLKPLLTEQKKGSFN